ncbi:hypothetical protein P7C70_g8903, partial [Phenoliferia sp. Uapishka_3]
MESNTALEARVARLEARMVRLDARATLPPSVTAPFEPQRWHSRWENGKANVQGRTIFPCVRQALDLFCMVLGVGPSRLLLLLNDGVEAGKIGQSIQEHRVRRWTAAELIVMMSIHDFPPSGVVALDAFARTFGCTASGLLDELYEAVVYGVVGVAMGESEREPHVRILSWWSAGF